MPINRFRGQYYFLSNFYPCPNGVEFDGDLFPTSEHAYQAAKIADRIGRDSFTITGSLGQCGPMVAKMKGKHVIKRPSWDSERAKFMEMIVRSKFLRDPKLVKHLIDTDDQKIVEGHTGDKFWGGKANHLGNILMKVREEVRRPQIDVSVTEHIDEDQPSRSHKGNSFEVLVTYGAELTEHLYPQVTEQFGDILNRWCRRHCVCLDLYLFHVMDPTGIVQVVDRESHLFDYADMHRHVSIIARHIEDVDTGCAGDSVSCEDEEAMQCEMGLPSRFVSWLQRRLSEEAPDDAGCLFDCVFCCLAGATSDDLLEQANDTANMLREQGLSTIADELVDQLYANLG